MARPSDPHARIELLRAAEAVFTELGLDRAKVEEITGRAGRSKGSFYLHFDSKEDAFRQIVEPVVARLADILDEEYLDDEVRADPSRLLAAWADADARLFEYLWQTRGLVGLLFHGGRSAGFGYLIDEFAERARARIVEGMRLEIQFGLYRADLDVELASMVIAGAYDRVARAVVSSPVKPDLRRWLSELHQVVLRGIASTRMAASLPAPVERVDPQVRNVAPAPVAARISASAGDRRSSHGSNARTRTRTRR